MVDHDEARASAQRAQQAMKTPVTYHDGNGNQSQFVNVPGLRGQSLDNMPNVPGMADTLSRMTGA